MADPRDPAAGRGGQRQGADAQALRGLCEHVEAASAHTRSLAAGLTPLTPDPGSPPAPAAVADVLTAAVGALHAAADALADSSQALRTSADRYVAAERTAAIAVQRVTVLERRDP